MITSFSNPLVKRIKRLRQKKYRQQEAAFFIEGLRVALTAVEQQAPIETIVYAPELLASEAGRQAIARQQAQGSIPCIALSAAVFQAISERDNPTGIGAIVRIAWRDLKALPVRPQSIFVALEGVSDPGNLGTILRTMDAAGATALILVGQTADPFHSTAVKASMGALFTVPVVQLASLDLLWSWAESHDIQVVATSARAQQLFWQATYRFPTLLLLGSEGEGLSPDVLALADLAVTIPMRGSASSLNLAVATGIILYEMRWKLEQGNQ